ncbi:MAG: phenylalanine--tRNA ligase beta subunit-related protein [Actinomycetota bacterium]|nr:phenylalanine--tRNA ligase beta subunit-related protein [Actinomycetota bacterium]
MPDPLSLTIAGQVGERHPDILVGGFLASGLRAAAARVEAQPFPTDTAQALVNQDVIIELAADHPLIRDWRAAIAASGLKPSTYKSSPEQLARRTLKSGPVRTGLPLVDLYCEVATRHLAPLGGYDVARLPSPDIDLRMADPSADTFAPLGGRDGDMPLTDRVVVYAAGHTVLCWAYNCRDSRDTCLTAATDAALFLGEAVTARQHDALRTALEDLIGRLGAAGAEVGPVAYAERGSPVVELAPGA